MLPRLKTSDPLAESGAPSETADATVLDFRKPGGTANWQLRSNNPRKDDQDLEPLRQQVNSIIEEILADTSPEDAEIREKLRGHVAKHPGLPERALLRHLLTVSDEQNQSA